jgi:hypothetical protein
MSGGILGGGLQSSGAVTTNQINAASGSTVTVSAQVSLIIRGTAAGQLCLGASDASTATAGGIQAVPATVLGYLVAYIGTTPWSETTEVRRRGHLCHEAPANRSRSLCFRRRSGSRRAAE